MEIKKAWNEKPSNRRRCFCDTCNCNTDESSVRNIRFHTSGLHMNKTDNNSRKTSKLQLKWKWTRNRSIVIHSSISRPKPIHFDHPLKKRKKEKKILILVLTKSYVEQARLKTKQDPRTPVWNWRKYLSWLEKFCVHQTKSSQSTSKDSSEFILAYAHCISGRKRWLMCCLWQGKSSYFCWSKPSLEVELQRFLQPHKISFLKEGWCKEGPNSWSTWGNAYLNRVFCSL